MTTFANLFLVGLALLPLSSQPQSLEIKLASPAREVELGQPIHLTLNYENVGSEPLFLKRPKDLGPESLEIHARIGQCQLLSKPAHFTMELADLRFLFVPLMPGHELKTNLFPINDLSGFDLLRLRKPGKYSLKVSLRSFGSTIEGQVWPIWRGEVESNEIVIEVKKPSIDTLQMWRRRLAECLKEPLCEDLEMVVFFTLVADPDSAAALRSLFQRDYLANPMISDILVNLGESADASLLNWAASNPDLDGRLRDHFLEQLEAVENPPESNCTH